MSQNVEKDDEVRFSLRVPKDLDRDLEKRAKLKQTSKNSLIITMLNEAIREKDNLLHYNVYNDHVTIWDGSMNRLVDVYIHNNKLSCDFDLTSSCRHVEFARRVPKVQKAFEERGIKSR